MNRYLVKVAESLSTKLIHLSFDGSKEGVWDPRLPAGMELESSKDVSDPEPEVNRISFSDDPEKSFRSIYPNISHYFEDHDYPYMDVYSYSPELTGKERIIKPEKLTRDRSVWDAHETNEYWSLDPVRMKVTGRYRFYNPGSEAEARFTYPFGDSKNHSKQRSIGPERIQYKKLETGD